MNSAWILLVEDDLDHVALALRALRKSGVDAQIVVAHSGAEALECLFGEQPPTRDSAPRVIFLDLKLPHMNGFEVLRRLRSRDVTATLPVVVMTSSDEECDKEESYNLGANSFIQKPVDYDHFVDVIRQTGNYWLKLNQVGSRG
ncbi:MAG TPA: response regulator [Symbiobacteriaceae bacterium]|nr:response regulator [Symbiobacteriaceae bacterium]